MVQVPSTVAVLNVQVPLVVDVKAPDVVTILYVAGPMRQLVDAPPPPGEGAGVGVGAVGVVPLPLPAPLALGDVGDEPPQNAVATLTATTATTLFK